MQKYHHKSAVLAMTSAVNMAHLSIFFTFIILNLNGKVCIINISYMEVTFCMQQ